MLTATERSSPFAWAQRPPEPIFPLGPDLTSWTDFGFQQTGSDTGSGCSEHKPTSDWIDGNSIWSGEADMQPPPLLPPQEQQRQLLPTRQLGSDRKRSIDLLHLSEYNSNDTSQVSSEDNRAKVPRRNWAQRSATSPSSSTSALALTRSHSHSDPPQMIGSESTPFHETTASYVIEVPIKEEAATQRGQVREELSRPPPPPPHLALNPPRLTPNRLPLLHPPPHLALSRLPPPQTSTHFNFTPHPSQPPTSHAPQVPSPIRLAFPRGGEEITEEKEERDLASQFGVTIEDKGGRYHCPYTNCTKGYVYGLTSAHLSSAAHLTSPQLTLPQPDLT